MYFFDTYALYEITQGSEGYSPFSGKVPLTTTILNAYELYFILIKQNQKELAEVFFNALMPHCLEIEQDDFKKAARFRFDNMKKGLSYIDAIGYITALRHGLIFVTGDDGFKDVEQVTLIK